MDYNNCAYGKHYLSIAIEVSRILCFLHNNIDHDSEIGSKSASIVIKHTNTNTDIWRRMDITCASLDVFWGCIIPQNVYKQIKGWTHFILKFMLKFVLQAHTQTHSPLIITNCSTFWMNISIKNPYFTLITEISTIFALQYFTENSNNGFTHTHKHSCFHFTPSCVCVSVCVFVCQHLPCNHKYISIMPK